MIFKSAKVIIYDKNEKILLLTRSDTHPKYPLQLDLPGGIVEENESDKTAITRECNEEIGLKINPTKLKLIKKVRFPHISRNLYEIHLEDVPSITLSWEHSEYKWFDLMDIIKMRKSKKYDPYFNILLEYLKSKEMIQ